MPTRARSVTDVVTQFVYDPHVAPFIEALLAAHAPQRAAPIPTSAPVAVPTNSYTARSSARRDRGVELRRRRLSSDHELREPLVERSERRDSGNAARGGRVEDRSVPLIDLSDRVTSSHDAEVREVIFKIPTPVPSNSSTPGPSLERPPPGRSPRQHDSRVLSPRQGDTGIASSPRRDHGLLSPRHNHGNLPAYGPESTTFSFLSLSQASSPELNHVELERLSFSGMSSHPVDTSDQWAEVQRPHPSERHTLEEDVVSLPETSTSGYEDAESYSPVNGTQSPVTIHSQLNRALGSPDALTERVVGQRTRRGPMSVVSVSESEGWDDGDSDWEGMRGSMRM